MRRRGQCIDGVLLLDKPSGPSSNSVLQAARRLLDAEKAGHTGTLDPLASGLLPVCFGEATKFAQALLDAPKRYTAEVRLGEATSTGDAEGEVIARGPVPTDGTRIREALAALVGMQMQMPPRHAALKYQGRAYYEYARAGVEIPREARRVEIAALRLLAFDPPRLCVDVECSKGTYIRTLAEDIGTALGSCAHLASLRRTATGGFEIGNAIALDALAALDAPARLTRLLPVDTLLAQLPSIVLDADATRAVQQGRAPHSSIAAGRYRAYGPDGQFVGVVESCPPELRALRMMRSPLDC